MGSKMGSKTTPKSTLSGTPFLGSPGRRARARGAPGKSGEIPPGFRGAKKCTFWTPKTDPILYLSVLQGGSFSQIPDLGAPGGQKSAHFCGYLITLSFGTLFWTLFGPRFLGWFWRV